MTNTRRRGSILLLCIAIIATLAVLAYGFVRMMQLHTESNDSVNRQLLAREAASMGVSHAVEQILRDYISEPFTRMDGPARAPFVSHVHPYNAWHGTDADASAANGVDVDDVATERLLFSPIFSRWYHLNWEAPTGFFIGMTDVQTQRAEIMGGNVTYDGRGRYYEPNFFNRAATGTAATSPTVPVRFGDLADPPTMAMPQRNQAIFYDENWNRVVASDQLAARTKARYRLRYAIGVMDLDGELLMNPDPGLDPARITTADPALAADAVTARVVRAQHAVPAVINAYTQWGRTGGADIRDPPLWTGGFTAGLRAEHVFIGRGYSSNFDRDSSRTPAAPLTFPLMYRRPNEHALFAQAAHNGNDTTVTDGPPHAVDLFYTTGAPAVTGLVQGGQVITPPTDRSRIMRRVLVGPQHSFKNFDFSTQGNQGDDRFGWDGILNSVGSLTPFGRGVRAGAPARFSGRVDTPWSVNIMTAPCQVIYAMVAGYMPPGAIAVRYNRYRSSDNVFLDSYWGEAIGGRDLFVDKLSPVFSRYAAPGRGSPAISPDYHVPASCTDDAAYRAPPARYPGVMAFNGYDTPRASRAWKNDSLGRFLRIDAATGEPVDRVAGGGGGRRNAPRDPYSGGTVWRHFDLSGTTQPDATQRPTGFPSSEYYHQVFAPHPDSIWEAIGEAMGATVAVARGQWLQYPTETANPLTWFNGGAWGGTKVQRIEDIDALFLANLGSDMTNPASTTPTVAWRGATGPNRLVSFTPQHNLASLRLHAAFDGMDAGGTVRTAAQRTQVVELIINDFRLSFFGSSPAYANFEALDLNGDGQIHCSSFATSGDATEASLGIDQHVAGSRAAVPAYFSHAGVFFIGKSRFWRIMARGEVWDNVLGVTLSEALLDTVICVDPVDSANELAAPAAQDPAGGQYSTHTLYQRWFYDLYRGHLSRKQ